MKIKSQITILFIAFASIVSCNKENISEVSDGSIKLSATSADTKTVLDGLNVNWTSTDVICVNGQASTAVTVDPDNPKKAVFTLPAVETPYNSVYPASVYKDAVTITVPATQSYVAGSFDAASAIMIGQSTETGKLTFNHVMSYIKLTVTAGQCTENILSVTVRGGDSENLSGDFTADYSAATITAAASEGTAITYNCGESGVAVGTPIIIAIPAAEYSKGIVIEVTSQTKSMTVSSTSKWVASPGTIITTSVPFNIGGTVGEIWTVSDWNVFAAAVNSESYDAWKNVKLCADITTTGDFTYISKTFDGTFDGQGHTLTGMKRTLPLIATLGKNGVIKNLTTNGKYSSTFANSRYAAGASFVKVNLGTIQGCTNNLDCDFGDTGKSYQAGIGLGFFANQNGGIIKSCTNNGDVHILARFTSEANNNRRCYAGGIAAVGHTLSSTSAETGTEVDATCVAGEFIDCTNNGDIFISIGNPTATGGYSERKAGYGGICGIVFLDGVSFSGCKNYGDITRTTSGYKENNSNWSSCLGGILGRNVAFPGTSADAINAASGYSTTITNCENHGNLIQDINVRGGITFSQTFNGNRGVYTGGIVGAYVGKDSSNKATVSGCTNTGNVFAGYSYDYNGYSAAGIAGFANHVTIDGCAVSGTIGTIESGWGIMKNSSPGTADELGGCGATGSIVGFAFGDIDIKGCTANPMITVREKKTPAAANYVFYGVAVGITSSSGGAINVKDSYFQPTVTLNGTSAGITSSNFLDYLGSSRLTSNKPVADNVQWGTL